MPERRAAVLIAVVLAAAACGEGEAPRERLAAASPATHAEETAHLSLRMDVAMGQEGSGMSFTASGEGSLDLAAGRGRMDLSFPGADSAMAMVFDSSAVYVRLPFGGGDTLRPWVRQEAGRAMGPGQTLGSRPGAWLDALERVEGEVTGLGSDTVRGVDVEGFGFTLEGPQVWGRGDSVPSALRDLEIPAKAWLDAQNRVRRMEMEIDMGRVMQAAQEHMEREGTGEGGMGAGMAALGGTATMTVEFFDFGTRVDVAVPDSGQVTDIESLRRRARERAGTGDGVR